MQTNPRTSCSVTVENICNEHSANFKVCLTTVQSVPTPFNVRRFPLNNHKIIKSKKFNAYHQSKAFELGLSRRMESVFCCWTLFDSSLTRILEQLSLPSWSTSRLCPSSKHAHQRSFKTKIFLCLIFWEMAKKKFRFNFLFFSSRGLQTSHIYANPVNLGGFVC